MNPLTSLHLIAGDSFGATLESVSQGMSKRTDSSRIQWMQRSSNLAWLSAALMLGFGAGMQDLAQGHVGWAACWWFLMPVAVICLALSGLKRFAPGDACLTSTRSPQMSVAAADQPVDFRKHLVGVLWRARDSIP